MALLYDHPVQVRSSATKQDKLHVARLAFQCPGSAMGDWSAPMGWTSSVVSEHYKTLLHAPFSLVLVAMCLFDSSSTGFAYLGGNKKYRVFQSDSNLLGKVMDV